MASSPLVSVILANYNGQRYLRACIESVLAQTYRNLEFIVVDDGSSDGSASLIAELVKGEPRARPVFLAKNQGQAEGFNQGLLQARGELVSFLDSDDLWFPAKLDRIVAEFGDPGIVAFHQHHLRILEDDAPTDRSYRSVLAVGDVYGEACRSRRMPEFVPTSGLTFSRRVLEKVGPIPRAFRTCADGYLTRTAMCYGRVSGTDEPLGAYRVHASNQTFNNPGFDGGKYVRELLVPHLNEFYRARGLPLEFPVPSVPEVRTVSRPMDVLRLGAGDRVLVVRSAPVDRVGQVLSGIFCAAPTAHVDLLVQPAYAAVFSDPRITCVTLEAGPLGARSLQEPGRKALQANQYAVALVPYDEHDGRNYGNVHQFIRDLAPGCLIVGVGAYGRLFAVNSGAPQEPPESVFAPLPDWASLRDCHAGSRGVIIGPAAREQAGRLAAFSGVVTFASDALFQIYPQTTWRATYYTVADPGLAARESHNLRLLRGMMLLPLPLRPISFSGIRALWYEQRNDNRELLAGAVSASGSREYAFSADVAQGVQLGRSVFFQQLQLAFHMGIREIGWFGVDGAPASSESGVKNRDFFAREDLQSARRFFEKAGGHFVAIN